MKMLNFLVMIIFGAIAVKFTIRAVREISCQTYDGLVILCAVACIVAFAVNLKRFLSTKDD